LVLESKWLPTTTRINLTKKKRRSYGTIRCARSFCPLVATNPQSHQSQHFEKNHDAILFAIDCSRSVFALRDNPNFEDPKTSHLLGARFRLGHVLQHDALLSLVLVSFARVLTIGALHTCRNESGSGSEIKKGTTNRRPSSMHPRGDSLNRNHHHGRFFPHLGKEGYQQRKT